jgi:hypothetical protein
MAIYAFNKIAPKEAFLREKYMRSSKFYGIQPLQRSNICLRIDYVAIMRAFM